MKKTVVTLKSVRQLTIIQKVIGHYDYNPEGNWSLASVQKKYIELRNLLGSEDRFELVPKTYTNSGGITWIYNIMDTVADGVKLNDKACIELSIGYIEDNIMGTYTGYIRESMARSLKNATLTDLQKNRLIKVFYGS